MIMADVLSVTLIILGFWVAVPSLCLVLRSCFPAALERAQERLVEHPYRSASSGLLVGGLGVVGVSILGKIPGLGKIGAGLAGSFGILLSVLGLAALGTRVGEGLPSPVDRERPWFPTVRGTLLVSICCTLPFLGWFVLLPLALCLGLGAGFGAWRARGEGGTVAPAAVPPEAPGPAASGVQP